MAVIDISNKKKIIIELEEKEEIDITQNPINTVIKIKNKTT